MTPDGLGRFEARLVRFVEDQVIAVMRNTTARHRAEEALRESEERWRAWQKMEAIGRLAGGVAHDFNNLLSVILGRVSILMRELGSPLHAHAAEISGAAERAAALTRQLLAFGRKQVLNPTVLDVDAVIAQMSGMLEPMIGEQITLFITSSSDALAFADRGQLEQVIMNLVINARDAIDGRGTIAIATRCAHVDAEAAARRDGATVGEHVVVSVTDRGPGISPEVMAHLFEPFFTTKARGKGTGLGLSTVYGIVKQSGGHIVVTSTKDEGTKFEIFLPRAKGPSSLPEPAHQHREQPLPRGRERVLVVEDEDGIRRLMVEILRGCGYTVLSARDGEHALGLLRATRDPIELLLSDVVMPGLGGHELARAARESHPGIRVLLTSGYDDSVGDDDQFPFLAKPFDAMALARSVRDVIDGKTGK
jgi:signal transduction histidine kinase/CheY-like chemotaxis protein